MTALVGSQGFAQERSSLFGRDSLQGVYVRDSAIAVEKIALAERLERLKEWNKSAEIYQEIIEQYADRVVPSRVDASNQIVQYTSVVTAVQERLAQWPADGLSAYRNRYETAAQSLLDNDDPASGDDPAKLHKVANQFFVTETARKAAIRLIDLQLQNGDFAAAAWLGDRLLKWHPSIDLERPLVLFRTAIAYRLLGNVEAAEARATELQSNHANATGVVRGETVILAKALADELRAEVAIQSTAGDSWPTAFGSFSRDRVPQASTGSGARLFSVPIVRTLPRLPNVNRQQTDIDKNERDAGFATGILPVIDRGELYFQDNQRIYGLSLDSGLPLPGWAETYGGDRGGRYSMANAWPTPLGAQLAVSLSDDAVFAVLGQNDVRAMLYAGNIAAQRESRLVCLDRRTGAERWSFAASALGRADEKASARSMELVGIPVVTADKVYITVQSGMGVQFQKCELIALDRYSGALRWRTYIASASTNSQIWDVESNTLDEPVPQVSLADGRLYVCTSLGATAAVDATDGSIIWLNLYPRNQPDQNRMLQLRQGIAGRGNASRRSRPWAHNPVIVSGNRAFTLPRSSEFVFINDSSTGEEIARIPVKPFDDADTLIGVTGEKLVIGGMKAVYCLDWTKFKPEAPVGQYVKWSSTFKKGSFDDASIRGRSFLTHDSVYVPTAWQMSRIQLSNGKAVASYPGDGREWGDEESAGNLLVMQDHVIIAGSEQVAVYTDLNVAMQKLDREVAADATSPRPRLRYAEVMFVAGRHDLAAAKMDEAAQLLGGIGSLQSGPDRDRLFNSSLNFARKLTAHPSVTPEIVNGFFDRAANAAESPQQQVMYRIARARWLNRQRDDAGELAMYQQILASPGLRQETVSGDGPATSAAYFAERAVADIVARVPAVYAPIEAQARAEFDAVANANDPEKLLAVAQTYPNSQVSAAALFASAGIFEQRGDHRQAVTILRALLPRNLSKNDRLVCMETLARNYLMLPNRLEVATSRLAQAAELAPSGKLSRPLQLPDGRVLDGMTFAAAADALRQFRRENSRQRLPTIPLPPGDGPADKLPPAFVAAAGPIEGVARLLRPPSDAARLDRLVVFQTDLGVKVFEVGPAASLRPLFDSAVSEPPVGCTWVGQSLLYWTPSRMVFVRGDDSGHALWEVPLSQIPMIEASLAGQEELALSSQDLNEPVDGQANLVNPRNDRLFNARNRNVFVRQGGQIIVRQGNVVRVLPGNQPNAAGDHDERIIQARALADRVIVSTNFGRILAFNLADGSCLWQVRPTERPMDRLLATDDFVASMFFEDTSAQIVAVDVGTGQVVFRRAFPREVGVINLCLAPDGKLLWLLPEALFAKDLFDPSDRPTFSRTIRPPDGGPVFGMETRLLDQMLVVDDRILVLSDNGQSVRAFALDDGQPITQQANEGNLTIERRYRTGNPDWNVRLTVIGTRLYAMGVNSGSLLSHDLERADSTVTHLVRSPDTNVRWSGREVVATTTHVLKLEEPTNAVRDRRRNNNAGAAGPDGLRIIAFRRGQSESGRENGRLDHQFVAPGFITSEQWQPIEGGIVYLTTDRRLHVLRGNG